MRTIQLFRACLVLCLVLCLGLWACGAQAAVSGNAQIALAGRGAFDELATALQQQADGGAMKVADWHALCFAYYRLKRYDRIGGCLDALESSLAARDKSTRLFGLEDATPTVFIMRAETALELAQYEPALQQAQRAQAWYHEEGDNDKDILIQALAVQAIAYRNLGQGDKAQAALSELRKVPANILGDDAIGAKALALARVCMSLGYWQEALDALALDKTLALRSFLDNLATGAFLRNENNWVWIELPRAFMENKALLELGQTERAKRGYESMLKVEQLAANGEIHWMVLADYAGILESENAYDQAIAAYGKALLEIERQRSSINTEANKIGFIGDKQDVYARLIALLLKQGRNAEALEVVERSKSRTLVDMLASKQRFALPVGARGQALDIAQAVSDIDRRDLLQRQQSLATVRGTAQREGALAPAALPLELRGLLSVKALKPQEIQALLAPDETLLAYFAHGSTMVAMVVQRDSITAQPIETKDLERDIRNFRAGISDQLDVQPLAQALYQRLVAPVAARLTSPKLTIVAHGPLHYLPFAALMQSERYLADQFSIRMLPSASVLQFLQQRPVADAPHSLVLGNPDLYNRKYDLPGAQIEAQTVAGLLPSAQLLLGKEASKAAFSGLAPGARVVHVASHGEFDDVHPLQSALLLSAPKIQDGRLTVSDMYELSLDADLVTLSACETGLGAVASGDDVVGLTRGLLYAGARSVVTSLWKVDDDATGLLMANLYKNLRGQRPAEALRKAQWDTRKQYPHPYYWAAFYLTGMN
jgi:CHAT domain-containing protein/tetratricopeptide (TPR) repeat protein